MKKYLMIAAAALAVAAPIYTAQAEDAEMATEAAVEVQEMTLADGTKIHVKGEEVFVVDAEGNKVPAPDGVHTLEDGSTVETMGGMIVAPAAPAEEMMHEDGAAH